MKNKKLLVLLSATLIALTGCNNGGGTSSSAAGTSSSITPTSVPTSSATPSSSTASSVTSVSIYGSAESPISIAQAKEIATGTASTEDCYVTGYVSTVKAGTDNEYTIELSDAEDGNTSFTFYWGTLAEGIDVPVIGDKIVAKGKLLYYNNYKYELTDGVVIKLTKGTKKYAVTTSIVDTEGDASTNATVTGIPSENILPGTSVTFTITPVSGFEIDSVKYNDSDLPQNTDGSYTFSSGYENAIKIVVAEAAGLKYKLTTSTLDNFPTAYPKADSPAEATYTKDGTTIGFVTTMANFGDGIQSRLKQGGGYNNGTYLYNKDALPEAISSIEITANTKWTSNTSSLKVKFSATPFTTATKDTKFDATITNSTTTIACDVADAKYVYFIHDVTGAVYIDEITINFATNTTNK